MTDFWNNRYGKNHYAYGIEPNVYIKQSLDQLTPGTILFPAEGEGRNAVYAAKTGWQVTAFDMSSAAKTKASKLASQNDVIIDYQISAAENFKSKQKFDVVALNYAHFPKEIRASIHKQLVSLLKPGGTIIFEAFSKDQLQYTSGGPKDENMLFSIKEITNEFSNITFQELKQEVVILAEGEYHQGQASVIRFMGKLTQP